MKINQIKLDKVKCETCDNVIIKSNWSKRFCKPCIKERIKNSDTLELVGIKLTHTKTHPYTLSRSQNYRRNQ